MSTLLARLWNKTGLELLTCALFLVGAVLALCPAALYSQQGASEPPPDLPTRAVLEVDSPERSLYRIAVPELLGGGAADGAEVIRNDLRLSSLFNVLDTRSFIADVGAEWIGIAPQAWLSVGAQGVVKGKIDQKGNILAVEMRLYELARGTEPILVRNYKGQKDALRGFMHNFANEILRALTGKVGSFGTQLTFARRVGPGRKDVYIADFDGHRVGRVSSGRGVSMLPNFGPGGIWYSVLTTRGMFITRTGMKDKPLITGNGTNMGVSFCNGRAYFSSSRDGNSEIYSSKPDGTDARRLTRDPGIDVSPTCGPGGQIAFVSSRHGGPQIFVMNGDGSGARRLTYRGSYNQTPAWCKDPESSLIAFTGRADDGLDVFTLNLKTGQYTRLTQAQGVNKDPAFSPDCRMVAFASSRGGIFISNPEGLNQNKVIAGAAETIRWSP
jgi:TolB protein